MLKKVNKKKLKALKYTLITSTCLYIGLHYSLPDGLSSKQLKTYINNKVENIVYADEEDCNEFLMGNDINPSKMNGVKKREIIRLDLCKVQNLNNFEKLNNVKTIEISNAQRLTSNDFDILNGSNVEEIYLNFNLEEMIRKNIKFDFNNINNKDIIENVSFHNVHTIDEYYGVIILNYFNNTDNIKCLDLKKYKSIDDKLNNIIKNIDYNEYDTEFDIIIKNLSFVSKHIQYDKLVSDVNRIQSDYEETSEEEKKFYHENLEKKNELSSDYNLYPLSSVIDNLDEEELGVCVNFASLNSILCIKRNVPVFRVQGNYNSGGHAWNIYFPKDLNKPVYIDPTFLDNNDKLYDDIKNYLSDKSISEYQELYKKLYVNIKENSSYKINTRIVDYYYDVIFNSNNIIGTQSELDPFVLAYKTLLLLALYNLLSFAISLTKQITEYDKENKKIKCTLKKFFFGPEEEKNKIK